MEGISRGNSVRVGGHDVTRLAAADHRQQDGRLGEVGTAGDGQRDGRHRDDCHVHEYTYRGQDHGRQRQRQQGAGLTQFLDNGLGDGGSRTRFDQHAGQYAGRQDPHHRSGDPLGAADHQGDGLAEIGAADQAASERADDHAVSGRNLLQNEEDGDGERRDGAKGSNRDHDGHLQWE